MKIQTPSRGWLVLPLLAWMAFVTYTLNWLAPLRHPCKTITPEQFQKNVFGWIDPDSGFPAMGHIYPYSIDGYWLLFPASEGLPIHGLVPARIPEAEFAKGWRAIEETLRSTPASGEHSPHFYMAVARWNCREPNMQTLDTFIQDCCEMKKAWLAQNIDRYRYELSQSIAKDCWLYEAAMLERQYPSMILIEWVWLCGIPWLAVWPWLMQRSLARKALTIACIPFLSFLPIYGGFGNYWSGDGIIYPYWMNYSWKQICNIVQFFSIETINCDRALLQLFPTVSHHVNVDNIYNAYRNPVYMLLQGIKLALLWLAVRWFVGFLIKHWEYRKNLFHSRIK